jgi:hypothetical protein
MNKRDDLAEKNCTKSIIDFRVQNPASPRSAIQKHTKIVVSSKPSVGREDFCFVSRSSKLTSPSFAFGCSNTSAKKIQTTANNFLLVTYTPRLLFD